MLPIAMNQVNVRRLREVLKESDFYFLMKMSSFLIKNGVTEYSKKVHDEVQNDLNSHPLRKRLHELLMDCYTRLAIQHPLISKENRSIEMCYKLPEKIDLPKDLIFLGMDLIEGGNSLVVVDFNDDLMVGKK